MDCADSEVNQTKDPGQPLDVLKGEYRFIGRLLGKNGGEYRFIGRLLGKNGLGIRNLFLRPLAVKGKIEPWRQQHFNSGRLHLRKLTTFPADCERYSEVLSGFYLIAGDIARP